MKLNSKLNILVVTLLVMVITTAASNPSLGLLIESINTDAFPLIEVRLSAWDSSGKPLESLSPSNFQIVENKGNPLQPGSVSVDNDSPLAVALVLDVSGSMQGQALKDAQVAAARFLDRLGTEDQAALVAFSSDVDPDSAILKAEKEYAFTHELKVIYDAIEGLKAEGSTELYNALQKAIAMTAQLPEGHRAVLLLSDGMNDPENVGDPEIPLQMAKEMNVPVFIIGLGYNYDKDYLDMLASETGGLVRIAPRSSELAQTFDDIAELLNTQYVLTYESGLTSAGEQVETEFTLNNAGVSASRIVQIVGLDERIAAINISQTQEAAVNVSTSESIADVMVAEPTAQSLPMDEEVVLIQEDSQLQQLLVQPWFWLGIVGLLAVLIFFFSKKKRKPVVYHCARCGYKMAEDVTTCPECGETRKI